MNKLQKEQYKKELNRLRVHMNKKYSGCLKDKIVMKKLKKAAKTIVLKNTFWYKIKHFFIFVGAKYRQYRKE